MRPRTVSLLILAAAAILLPSSLSAQETDARETLSVERLLEVLADVEAWTEATVELRQAIKSYDQEGFVRAADGLRARFDPIMVLMATTNPAAEVRQAAVLLLMATKGVELALWHYIYGALSSQTTSYDHGDVLLKAAMSQLTGARTLFDR